MPRPLWRLLAAHLATGALALFGACNKSPASSIAGVNGEGTADPSALRTVELASVRDEVWPRTLRVTGELAAFEEATLATKVAGRLATIDVDVGTRVKAGEPLARIETRDFELRVAQANAALLAARARLGLAAKDPSNADPSSSATSDTGDSDAVDPESTALVRGAKAELDEAVRERTRAEQLADKGVGAQAALDAERARELIAESRLQDAHEECENRRAQLAQRRADLAIAEQQLADATIVAPFDGAVAARLADRGEFLAVGAPLVRMVRFDPVRLRLHVPERSVAAVRVGQPVQFLLADGSARDGALARLSPEVDARSRTLLVEAELANADDALRPGAFAEAELVIDPTARARVVPLTALIRFAGVDRVLTVVDGVAIERAVIVGRLDGERAELLAGVEIGERIVVAPGSLRGGAKVHVTP